MKNIIRHIAIIALIVALAACGYIAHQYYFAAQEEVKIQKIILNFVNESNDLNSSKKK